LSNFVASYTLLHATTIVRARQSSRLLQDVAECFVAIIGVLRVRIGLNVCCC